MKSTSKSTHSTLPSDSQTRVTTPQAGRTASSTATKSASARKNPSARTGAATKSSGTSANQASTRPSTTQDSSRKPAKGSNAQAANASMDAIKSDRVTLIAFYVMIGAVLAGMLYFVALLIFT